MFLSVAAKKLLKYNFSVKQIFRFKNNLVNPKLRTTTERGFLRKVIQNTRGCSIFTYDQELEPHVDQFQHDELIKKLIHLTRNILRNRFKYEHNQEIIQNELPRLHNECVVQSSKWPIEKTLFAMDIWKTHLDQPNVQLFFEESMNRYLNQIHSLSDPFALQIIYYAANGWEWKSKLYEEKIIQKMIKMMRDSETPFNHMAIYCLALFKNCAEIGNVEFIESFLKYLLEQNFQEEESIAVTCMLKAARKFSTRDQIHEIEKIQTKLMPYVRQCDLISMTHVIQLGQKERVHNPQLVEFILNIFEKNLNKLRGKDIERCLLIIATFNFESSSRIEERFSKKALEYFKESPEQRKKFPESAILAISYLAVKGFYDNTLLKWALEMGSRKEFAIINSENISNDSLLVIDAFAKINLANSYRGPVLSNQIVSKLAENREHDNYNKRFVDDLKNIFDKNNHKYIVCKPIPYGGADFIFVHNKRTNQTVKLNVNVDENKILNAAEMHQNHPDLKAVAVVATSSIFRSNKYGGFFQMKLNNLKSLGFEVVVFRKRDWKKNPNQDLKQWYLTLQLYRSNVFLFENK